MHKANAEVQSFEIVCPKDLVFRYAFRYNSLYSLFSYRNMLLFSRRRQKVESFVFGSIDIAIVSCTSAQAAEDMWKRGGGGGGLDADQTSNLFVSSRGCDLTS